MMRASTGWPTVPAMTYAAVSTDASTYVPCWSTTSRTSASALIEAGSRPTSEVDSR